jgi:hypothetical protein
MSYSYSVPTVRTLRALGLIPVTVASTKSMPLAISGASRSKEMSAMVLEPMATHGNEGMKMKRRSLEITVT